MHGFGNAAQRGARHKGTVLPDHVVERLGAHAHRHGTRHGIVRHIGNIEKILHASTIATRTIATCSASTTHGAWPRIAV